MTSPVVLIPFSATSYVLWGGICVSENYVILADVKQFRNARHKENIRVDLYLCLIN
jgi:hypothetical protein